MRWVVIFAALAFVPASASFAVSQCGAVGYEDRQNDQGVWRANRSGGRQDHRGLSQAELRGMKRFSG
jgi:hypothetical protein